MKYHEIIIYSIYICVTAKNKQQFPKNIWKHFFALPGNPFPSHFVFLLLGWDFCRCADTSGALDLVVASEISSAKVKLLVKVRVFTNQWGKSGEQQQQTRQQKTHSFYPKCTKMHVNEYIFV